MGRSPWRREWQPTPLFLSGEFHGQRSLAGYTPWGNKESDTTERLTHTKKGGIVSHFSVRNIKFSEKGSNGPSQVGAKTNVQPLSLLPRFLLQRKSTPPFRCRPGRGTGLKHLGMGQNVLEPEPPVLGVVTKVPQSGLGEVFGRGFHSWTRKERARLGAEGPKLAPCCHLSAPTLDSLGPICFSQPGKRRHRPCS